MAGPPFINSTGLIPKILNRIQQASVPARYTQDYQASVLGYGSGSARPFIPFLKRLGFIQSDGTPTDIYTRFRNADSCGAAMAQAMRIGFSEIFKRNEFSHALSDEKLKNLVVEITGKEPSDSTVTAIVGSFKACKQFADFEVSSDVKSDVPDLTLHTELSGDNQRNTRVKSDLRLAYTININLPETTNLDVYNAIFSAIKQNLLDDVE